MVTVQEAGGAASRQRWVFLPTGDEDGSFSIRTTSGQALDLDTGQGKLQLYTYLGYNNQRWLISRNEDGSTAILNAHNQMALSVSADGWSLVLEAPADTAAQKWSLEF
ncbi:hypothetical protein D3C73_1131490 [compost metagenome]